MSGEDSLTVFVITTGEEAMDQCLAALDRQTRGFRLEEIRDVYPMSAAFQAMPDRCQTPYFLQVDADMVLEPHAVELLHDALMRSSPRIFQVSGQLWEDGEPRGAVKCWKRSLFRWFSFRDVRTVDRDLYKRTRRLALGRRHFGERVGTHLAHHSPEAEWLKAKADVEKWRFLGRPPEMYASPLVESFIQRWPAEPHRLAAALLGALTTEPRLSRSKDIRYERGVREEAAAMLTMPEAGEPPLEATECEELGRRFAAAYSGRGREPLAAAVAARFGADEAAAARILELTAR